MSVERIYSNKKNLECDICGASADYLYKIYIFDNSPDCICHECRDLICHYVNILYDLVREGRNLEYKLLEGKLKNE